jgi:hypothetical protein
MNSIVIRVCTSRKLDDPIDAILIGQDGDEA